MTVEAITLKQIDKKRGFGSQQDDSTVEIDHGQLVLLGGAGEPVRDGEL